MSTNRVFDDEYVAKYGDPRMDGWPLMDSPIYPVACTVAYLIFVKAVGPALMRNRQPFSIQTLMVSYNFAMVFISAWMTYRIAVYGWFRHYSWRCEPITISYEPADLLIVEACWVYVISKIVELVDTVFFVLRKKESQISALHLFHHALVPVTTWYGAKYGSGGYNTIFPLCNTFVHSFMYLYYAIAAMGPSYQKYIWWKKYITKLQLLQFTVVMTYMMQLYLFPVPGCKVSRFLIWLSVVQGVIFFVLFVHFYLTAYMKKKDGGQSNGDRPSKND